RHIFKVSNAVVSQVSEQTAVGMPGTNVRIGLKGIQEFLKHGCHLPFSLNGRLYGRRSGISNCCHTFCNGKGSDWLAADERKGVLVAVVVGTLKQDAGSIHIAHLEINVYGRHCILEKRLSVCLEFVFHMGLMFLFFEIGKSLSKRRPA